MFFTFTYTCGLSFGRNTSSEGIGSNNCAFVFGMWIDDSIVVDVPDRMSFATIITSGSVYVISLHWKYSVIPS